MRRAAEAIRGERPNGLSRRPPGGAAAMGACRAACALRPIRPGRGAVRGGSGDLALGSDSRSAGGAGRRRSPWR